jgi:hypothetical protein
VRRHQGKARKRVIEALDVIDMKPEVVVRGQHREAEHDQRAASDQQRPGAAGADGPEESEFVEVAAAHGQPCCDYMARRLTNTDEVFSPGDRSRKRWLKV